MKNNKSKDVWNAVYYKQHSTFQFARGLDLLDKLDFKKTDCVLDIGCGDGRITAEIAKCVPYGLVLGIDASKSMIVEAQNSFMNINNASFQHMDVTKFKTEQQFDKAFSSGCFHWVPDHGAALNNIFNVLKPGGMLIVSMAAEDAGPIKKVLMSEKWTSLMHNKEKKFFPETKESFKHLLATCGFVNIKTELHQRERCFKNVQELCAWALAWLPAATGLAQPQLDEIAMDIACATQEGGRLCLQSPNVVAYAQRP